MRYFVAFMIIWAVPAAGLYALLAAVQLESGLAGLAFLSVVFGIPLAFVLTVVLLLTMAVEGVTNAVAARGQ